MRARFRLPESLALLAGLLIPATSVMAGGEIPHLVADVEDAVATWQKARIEAAGGTLRGCGDYVIGCSGSTTTGRFRGGESTEMDGVSSVSVGGLTNRYFDKATQFVKRDAIESDWAIVPVEPGDTSLRMEASGMLDDLGASVSGTLCAEPDVSRLPD